MTDITYKPDRTKGPRGKTDWEALRQMTDMEVERRAREDSDALPLDEDHLKRMRRVPDPKRIRNDLGMTVEKFADTFGLAPARVRALEQGDAAPTNAERTLLRVIAANPALVETAAKTEIVQHISDVNYHVVPKTGRWAVRKIGASSATSLHDTQEEAIKAARHVARRKGGTLVIHGKNGRVREQVSYSRRRVA